MSNQASEDELRETVKAEIKYRVEQEYEKYHNDTTFEYNGVDFWREQIENKLSDTLLSIIRTEKLKLLAEVRERVVGEDLPPDVATDSGIGYSRQQFAINMGKAGQRTELTKLEADHDR